MFTVQEGGLTFIHSQGLRLLIQTTERASAVGARLLLIQGQPGVHRVFEISGLDAHFDFISDL